MNYYRKAIEQDRVIDFFRGEGEYFEADRERQGIYNFSFTSYAIMGYGIECGESILYKKLNEKPINTACCAGM